MHSMWFVAVALVAVATGLTWWAGRWAADQARHTDDLVEPVTSQRADVRRTARRRSATGERIDGRR